MDADERRRLYVSYLGEEGYKAQVDDDGDIYFRFEGRNYYIVVDKKDDMFFRILYNGFWAIENGVELARAAVAADYVNRTCKVAKMYLHANGENVSASVELFLDRPESFRYVFQRSMSALRYAVNQFVDHIKAA